MKKNSMKRPKNIRDLCTKLQNSPQARSILERKISGLQKLFRKIANDLEENQKDYKKVILKLCKTKGEMSYYEAKLQFQYDVLLSDEYYNEFIGCKIHSKHIRKNDG